MGFESVEPEEKKEPPNFTHLIKYSVDYLEYGRDYLERINDNKTLSTHYGGNITPLGADKLKVIEWIESLIKFKDNDILNKLLELNIGSTFLTLMKRYEMNTIAHHKIYSIINDSIKTNEEIFIEIVVLFNNIVYYQM